MAKTEVLITAVKSFVLPVPRANPLKKFKNERVSSYKLVRFRNLKYIVS